MLDLLFVSLFQAASGDPAVTPPADNPPAAASEEAPAPQARQRRHCRNVRQTGTYMTVRVCRTAEEEERIEAEMRRDVERVIDQKATPPESAIERGR